MAFDSKKTILLEKTYLYVRASLGFQLEGTSREKIPTNNGFYRFFVDNLQKAIGNSYVNILYDSQDLTLQCFCSDLYMDELMSSDSSAIEDVVEELKKNTSTIVEFENGVSAALASNHEDNVAVQTAISSVDELIKKNPNYQDLTGCFLVYTNINGNMPEYGDILVSSSDFIKADKNHDYYYAHFHYDCYNVIKSRNNVFMGFNFGGFSALRSYSPYGFYYRIKCLKNDGSIIYYSGFNACSPSSSSSSTTTYSLSLSLFDFFGIILSCDFFVISNGSFVNALNFCDGKIFSKSSFKGNNLFLCPKGNISSSLCQTFDYDFSGGYLDFRFCSNLSIDFLKSFNYVFLTDAGEFSFSGDSLGIKFISSGSNVVGCTNFPNIVVPSGVPLTINKLLGVRVEKNVAF